jgi:UPF0716 protein FxsA
VLELAVAIEVGRWIGALPTLGALVLISVLGAMLVRRQGSAAWRSLNGSLRAGEPPSRELADAAVLVLAGVLLLAPGFVSDLFAVLLLFPLTRPLARRPLERALARAAANRVTLLGSFPAGGRFGAVPGFGTPPGFGAGGSAPGFGSPGGTGVPTNPFGGGDVVEGEVLPDPDPPKTP